MTLTDTGPFVAIQDHGDPHHARCVEALKQVSKPLLVTLPVLTESMYLLGGRGGWRAQQRMWRLLKLQDIRVIAIDELLDRMAELMEEYKDSPMDFADASLVAVAESQGIRRIFTLDSHFRAYRLRGGRKLEVVPKGEPA